MVSSTNRHTFGKRLSSGSTLVRLHVNGDDATVSCLGYGRPFTVHAMLDKLLQTDVVVTIVIICLVFDDVIFLVLDDEEEDNKQVSNVVIGMPAVRDAL